MIIRCEIFLSDMLYMYVGPGQPGADPDLALTRPGPFFEGQGHSIGGPALRARARSGKNRPDLARTGP